MERKEAGGVAVTPSSPTRANMVVGSPVMVKDSGTKVGLRWEHDKKEERRCLCSMVAHRWLLLSIGEVWQ